jgi:dTDP-4-dehydrorhamnose 3,5-epimerase
VPFTIEDTAIPEVRIVRPKTFGDDRGWFGEIVQVDAFEPLGLPTRFVQVNQSRSARGVVRGLHFQWDPPQGKLMRVVRGRAFMIAADIRPGSPTLGKVVTFEGSDEEPVLFWAPASFARGFAALADPTEVEYFCTATYDARHESGIRFDDPTFAIDWPLSDPQLSAKDAAAGSLQDWLARPESAAFAWTPPRK